MPIDSIKLSNPAFTKLTSITVVADEDCITAVINIPEKTPRIREDVIAARMFLSFEPATF